MDSATFANLIKTDPDFALAFARAQAQVQALPQVQEQALVQDQDPSLPVVPLSSSSSESPPLETTDPPVVTSSGSPSSNDNPEPTSIGTNNQPTDQDTSDRDNNQIEESKSGLVPKPDPKVEEVEEGISVTTSETKPSGLTLPPVDLTKEESETEEVPVHPSGPSSDNKDTDPSVSKVQTSGQETSTGATAIIRKQPVQSVELPTSSSTESQANAEAKSESGNSGRLAPTDPKHKITKRADLNPGSGNSESNGNTEAAASVSKKRIGSDQDATTSNHPAKKKAKTASTKSSQSGSSDTSDDEEESESESEDSQDEEDDEVIEDIAKFQAQELETFLKHFNDDKKWSNGIFNGPGILRSQTLPSLKGKFDIPEDIVLELKPHHTKDPALCKRNKPKRNSSSDRKSKTPTSGAAAASSRSKPSSSSSSQPETDKTPRKRRPPGFLTYDRKGNNSKSIKELEDLEDATNKFERDIYPCLGTSLTLHYLCRISDHPAILKDHTSEGGVNCAYCGKKTEFYCNGCTASIISEDSTEREVRSVSYYCLECHATHLANLAIDLASKLCKDTFLG